LLNLNLYNKTAGWTRRVKTFSIPVGGAASVTVRRLVAEKGVATMGFDFGGATDNVIWAGEQWLNVVDNGKGHFFNSSIEVGTITVSNSYALVNVRDSEAAVIFIG
jgi:hypothetical protein